MRKSTLLHFSSAFCSMISLASNARADFTADPHQNMRTLYQGARAMAMGNAFVSVADDEEALFYNPAGLAGIESTSLQYINTELETSSDVVTATSSSYSQFQHLSGDSLNVLQGKDIYMHANYVPSFVTKGFGIAVITDQQLSLVTQNSAMPQVELGYQTTNGVQLGYAISLNGGKHSNSEFRIGAGLKFLSRRGGYYLLTQTQMVSLSEDELKQLVGNFGSGVGFDLGTQYVYHVNKHLHLQAAASYTEVGGVSFSTDTAEPLPGNLSLGVSVHYHFAAMAATLAYDMQHINAAVDARLRNHFGAEFSIPLFHFYAGLNQIYPTFGFGVDVWLVQVTALTYAQELSSVADVNRERRYMLQISMGF